MRDSFFESLPLPELSLWEKMKNQSGELDKPVEYFCEVAHARADTLANVERA